MEHVFPKNFSRSWPNAAQCNLTADFRSVRICSTNVFLKSKMESSPRLVDVGCWAGAAGLSFFLLHTETAEHARHERSASDTTRKKYSGRPFGPMIQVSYVSGSHAMKSLKKNAENVLHMDGYPHGRRKIFLARTEYPMELISDSKIWFILDELKRRTHERLMIR